MSKNITITFGDGTNHVYQNAPDTVTADEIIKRATQEFPNKTISNVDGEKSLPKEEVKPIPSNLQVGINAANKGIASVPDFLLNTPTNLMNLGKAAYGTAATALGRSDLAPELTENPDYARKAMSAMGFIKPQFEPVTTGQRILDIGVQGATGAAINPQSSVSNLIKALAIGGASGSAAGGVKELTGSDVGAMAAGLATPMAASKLGAMSRQNIQSLQDQQSRNALRDEVLNTGQKAGYVVPPSIINPSFINKRLESIGGKAATTQESQIRNQEATNALVRSDLGIPENKAISIKELNNIRAQAGTAYQDIANLSPIAEQALKKLKQARFDARTTMKHYNMQGDPKILEAANQLKNKADMLETVIENQAARANKPELVDKLKEARMLIAKSYNVEDALNVANGNVDARVLGSALDKGAPLTGDLSTVAKFSEAFSPYTREATQVPSPGVSKSEALAATLLGGGGLLAGGPVAGAIGAALPLLSGPTRSLVLSKPYQRLMAQPNYEPGQMAKMLATIPENTPEQSAMINAQLARVLAEQQPTRNER